MVKSSLSSQIKRTGNILRKGASDQIVEYNRRFESIKDLSYSFLVDLFVSNFSYKNAYDTAMRFFGSSLVLCARTISAAGVLANDMILL